MKKIVFLLMFIGLFGNAQVGIGTNTPSSSSMLDVSSSEKGVLIPRVNLTDLSTFAPITGTQTTGLLVFNTNTTTGVGFYFWDGTGWQAVGAASSGWALNGNAGTDFTQDFLGTTDNQPIVFRTNDEARAILGFDDGTSFFNFIADAELDGKTFSGNIEAFTILADLGQDGVPAEGVTAANAFGLDNQIYLRSGTTINNRMRGIRNRIWAINSNTISTVNGFVNDFKFEGAGSTSRTTTNVQMFDTNLRMTAGAGVNEYKAFNHTLQSAISINDFYGLWFERVDNISTGGLSRYYTFYQGFLGNNADRFFLYYNGDSDDSDPRSSDDNDFVVTGSGDLGLGTSTPNSTVQVNGSFSAAFTDTSAATTTFTANENHHTIRVLDNITTLSIPDATNLTGRIYVLIGTNGITSKTISVGGSSVIIDDVSNANITQLNANERYTIQSDGTNWIVIGN